MSGNTDVEKGNFAVKAGLAQVRDSHPRELARFSSVDGFSFLLRRRRHLRSPFFARDVFLLLLFFIFFLRTTTHTKVVSKESLRERRASTRIFKGRGEACLFFLRRSFVVYVVVVTEEEKC